MLLSPVTTTTDSNKLESIQNKFAHFCCRRFYQFDSPLNYDEILERLGLRTLHSRQRNIDTLFLINVFNNTIDCQSILGTVSQRVPSKLIRDFSIFSVGKALDLVLQLDARPRRIRFTNL
jgi:hypothetical protein